MFADKCHRNASTKRLAKKSNSSTKLAADTHRSETDFLRTEILTGLTMAKIALDSTRKSKRERNRANARKAYDAVLHFMRSSPLEGDEADEIKRGLAQLKSELVKLGEF